MGNCIHLNRLDGDAHMELGNNFMKEHEQNKAFQHYKKSLKLKKKEYGKYHPEVAKIYRNIADIYYVKTQYDDAIKYYHKSLDIKSEIFGPRHPDLALTYNNLGTAYYSLNQYEDALEYHGCALEIEIHNHIDRINNNRSGSNKNLALAYGNMGVAFYGNGDYFNALQYQERCLGILRSEYGERHIYTRTAHENINKTKLKMDKEQFHRKSNSKNSHYSEQLVEILTDRSQNNSPTHHNNNHHRARMDHRDNDPLLLGQKVDVSSDKNHNMKKKKIRRNMDRNDLRKKSSSTESESFDLSSGDPNLVMYHVDDAGTSSAKQQQNNGSSKGPTTINSTLDGKEFLMCRMLALRCDAPAHPAFHTVESNC